MLDFWFLNITERKRSSLYYDGIELNIMKINRLYKMEMFEEALPIFVNGRSDIIRFFLSVMKKIDIEAKKSNVNYET